MNRDWTSGPQTDRARLERFFDGLAIARANSTASDGQVNDTAILSEKSSKLLFQPHDLEFT